MTYLQNELIVNTIRNSKIDYIPVNVQPYVCNNFVVLDRLQLTDILTKNKSWKYSFASSHGGGLSTPLLWIESDSPIYEDYKILELYLGPVPAKVQPGAK